MPPTVQTLRQPPGEPLTLDEAKQAANVDLDDPSDDSWFGPAVTTARQLVESRLGVCLVSRTLLFSLDRFPRQGELFQGWAQGYSSTGLALWDQRVPLAEVGGASRLDRDAILLAPGPLQSVLSVQYLDAQGSLQTLATTEYRVDYAGARIVPASGKVWPSALWQTQAVRVQAVCGYGPVTTIALGISAGTRTVTPASMYGIYAQDVTTAYAGTALAVGEGASREVVTVTAATPTTFTAIFSQDHATGSAVRAGVPETPLAAMRMLIAHWYVNREAAGGQMVETPLGVDSLLYAAWDGCLN